MCVCVFVSENVVAYESMVTALLWRPSEGSLDRSIVLPLPETSSQKAAALPSLSGALPTPPPPLLDRQYSIITHATYLARDAQQQKQALPSPPSLLRPLSTEP